MLSSYPVAAMIPALDVERARQFYEGTLGFTPSAELPGALVYLSQGGTMFSIYPSSFAGTAQNTAMNWSVDDLVAEMNDLRARGIVFEEYNFPDFKTVNGVAEFPGGKVAWFKDTEGNILGLTQMT